jgi:hypothetical protein
MQATSVVEVKARRWFPGWSVSRATPTVIASAAKLSRRRYTLDRFAALAMMEGVRRALGTRE